ncbi:MAG: hypothetical protein R3C10_22410 [Pirellulales bacterium]
MIHSLTTSHHSVAGSVVKLLLVAAFYTGQARAQNASPDEHTGAIEAALSLPDTPRPLKIATSFQLLAVNSIDSEASAFQFTGILSLQWNDPRAAFDAGELGISEKVYQGDFQFAELAQAWFPQVILSNEAGDFERQAVLLRVAPDGTTTLRQAIRATAKTQLNLRRLPFDHQQLKISFQLFGFARDQVIFESPPTAVTYDLDELHVPQWAIVGVSATTDTSHEEASDSSTFVINIEVARKPFFLVRVVGIPLVFCVLLTFSVFWMNPSALAERMNISFIGILTSVAYLIVITDLLPQISYMTLAHGFLNFSLLAMCATAIENLLVAIREQNGKSAGSIDARCRWLFPLTYFLLIGFAAVVAFTVY